ncbi:Uncharacterized protein FWK35_00027556 [Aphis craccivora]|uniref:Uncharacterized protein n=1 Tax=Aphis craccivora TaxID=307492 RepID=A0A6G0YMV6_APHCR|nr:Uncharacterized protein FWK35_00027556 [Aphis craccivora]
MLCINNAIDIFYESIFRIIDENCFKKTIYTSKNPSWFSFLLRIKPRGGGEHLKHPDYTTAFSQNINNAFKQCI